MLLHRHRLRSIQHQGQAQGAEEGRVQTQDPQNAGW